jgi:F0F1-type ATP synthase assembly protein I
MRRGIILLILGVALNLLGYYLEEELLKYGWAMIIGVLAFGVGFLLIIYSLMRKIDRKSLLDDRQAAAEKAAE